MSQLSYGADPMQQGPDPRTPQLRPGFPGGPGRLGQAPGQTPEQSFAQSLMSARGSMGADAQAQANLATHPEVAMMQNENLLRNGAGYLSPEAKGAAFNAMRGDQQQREQYAHQMALTQLEGQQRQNLALLQDKAGGDQRFMDTMLLNKEMWPQMQEMLALRQKMGDRMAAGHHADRAAMLGVAPQAVMPGGAGPAGTEGGLPGASPAATTLDQHMAALADKASQAPTSAEYQGFFQKVAPGASWNEKDQLPVGGKLDLEQLGPALHSFGRLVGTPELAQQLARKLQALQGNADLGAFRDRLGVDAIHHAVEGSGRARGPIQVGNHTLNPEAQAASGLGRLLGNRQGYSIRTPGQNVAPTYWDNRAAPSMFKDVLPTLRPQSQMDRRHAAEAEMKLYDALGAMPGLGR